MLAYDLALWSAAVCCACQLACLTAFRAHLKASCSAQHAWLDFARLLLLVHASCGCYVSPACIACWRICVHLQQHHVLAFGSNVVTVMHAQRAVASAFGRTLGLCM